MEIRMARGDLESRTFFLKNSSGQTFSTEPDEIYFTVKKYPTDHDYLFQKTVTGNGIIKIETGKYQIKILPEDIQLSKPATNHE